MAQTRRSDKAGKSKKSPKRALSGAKDTRVHEPGDKKVSGNPDGRPPDKLCFTNTIRRELNKRKKFRRPDGSIMEASELELIAAKVIKELRTNTPVSSKLLEIVLNRIEGKPKEHVEIDGSLEFMNGIDAKDLLLQKLARLLADGEEEADSEEAG